MKVCLEPGCGEVQPEARCAEHRRATERARGTRQARGYDARYDKQRKRWAPRVATGSVLCWRCGQRITALEPWDLGHCDNDRGAIHGPEHPLCNRGARSIRCPHISHVA